MAWNPGQGGTEGSRHPGEPATGKQVGRGSRVWRCHYCPQSINNQDGSQPPSRPVLDPIGPRPLAPVLTLPGASRPQPQTFDLIRSYLTCPQPRDHIEGPWAAWPILQLLPDCLASGKVKNRLKKKSTSPQLPPTSARVPSSSAWASGRWTLFPSWLCPVLSAYAHEG